MRKEVDAKKFDCRKLLEQLQFDGVFPRASALFIVRTQSSSPVNVSRARHHPSVIPRDKAGFRLIRN